MIIDREKEDKYFHFSFVYVYSQFSVNKRIFIDSKQKVTKIH